LCWCAATRCGELTGLGLLTGLRGLGDLALAEAVVVALLEALVIVRDWVGRAGGVDRRTDGDGCAERAGGTCGNHASSYRSGTPQLFGSLVALVGGHVVRLLAPPVASL
jgi:hypothetical protein